MPTSRHNLAATVSSALVLMITVFGSPAQDVIISEFVAVNGAGLTDEDGDTSDWIELYNADSNTVDLAGWFLSDDMDNLQKWEFPNVTVSNGAYLVVFASDKNRTNATSELHTNFKLSGDGEYLGLTAPDGVTVVHAYSPEYPRQVTDTSYGTGGGASNITLLAEFAPCRAMVPTTTTTHAWTQPIGYDDSTWYSGTGGIGYERSSGYESLIGIDLEADMHNTNASAYARWPFTVEDPLAIVSLDLNIRYDDGFIAYLNGVSIASSNAPPTPLWNSPATGPHVDPQALIYEAFPVATPSSLLITGTNVLAIHLLNNGASSSDALAFPTLTGLADSVYGGGSERYFATPTPNAPNANDFLGFVKDTKFSADRGFYTNPVSVAIQTATDDATIRYTLDGSAPTDLNGVIYTNALVISNTTVLRAAAFKPGYRATDVDTQSYIFLDQVIHATNAPPGYPGQWTTQTGSARPSDYVMDPRIVDSPLYGPRMKAALLSHPTVSVVMDRADLFDPQTGIYANSQKVGPDWERPASAEFINFPDEANTHVNAGIRVYGNASRSPTRPKHNLRLIFRSEYGASKLEFPAFPSSDVQRFNGYMMRGQNGDSWIHPSAGQRTDATYIRDQAARDAQYAMGMPAPAQDHVHLYINGMYWGFYQSIERIQNDFMEENYGGEEEDYDLYKAVPGQQYPGIVDGTLTPWTNMLAIVNGGVAEDAQYRAVQEYLDLDNFIDYMLINFHNGNSDWDHNNWQAGRHRTDGSGFKFFVWDSERTVLGLTVDKTGLNNANKPTRIHNQLTANAEYRLRFADRLHRHFHNGGVLSPEGYAKLWNDRANEIRPALVAESARWGDYHRPSEPYTPDNEWETKLEYLNTVYCPQRTAIVLSQLSARGLYPAVSPPAFNQHGAEFAGQFELSMSASNTIYYTLDGTDPREALTGSAVGTEYTGPITLSHTVRVRARARAATEWSALTEALFVETSPSPIRISEIMYHPHVPEGTETNGAITESDFEFIEIVNPGTSTVGLAGMTFSDGITFDFTDGTVATLAPGEHAVVVSELPAFTNRYAGWQSMNLAGTFDGRLDDAGERVVLEVPTGETVMTVTYDQARGWPVKADGAGHSLIPLITEDPVGNALRYGGNWRASAYRGGSPGSDDPTPPETIVLNEVITHTDFDDPVNYPGYDSNDGIEIYNATGTNITLRNWYLSDEFDNLKKWTIPDAPIGSRDWMAFDEITGFHSPLTEGFGLNKAGEQVLLSYLPGTPQDRVADVVRFEGQENGASLGRLPDGTGRWRTLTPTPGDANAAAAQDVVVSEIMYHPRAVPESPEAESRDEYIEFHNPTDRTIELWTEAGPWRVDGGVRYTFATNTSLASGVRAVLVSFDPADGDLLEPFLHRHGMTGTSARVFGPYDGKLANSGERVALERPQPPDEDGEPIPWTIVDEVIYADSPPWPLGADGTGRPIVRRFPSAPGNEPSNWKLGVRADPGDAPARFAIVSPLPDATLFAPSSTHLLVEQDDELIDGTIQAVSFFADGVSFGVTTAPPYSTTLEVLHGHEGAHAIHATLTDGAGTHTSRQVTAIVSGVYNSPATNIQPDSATASGWLSHTGRGTVAVFWGRTPGGTDPAAWDHSIDMGDRVSTFASPLDDLLANATYRYRYRASNSYGVAWAQTNESFSTPAPDATTVDIVVSEPENDDIAAAFPVLLSTPSAQDVTVSFSTHDGSAFGYLDYAPTNGTVIIPAGATNANIIVTIHSDDRDERPSEQFRLRLDGAVNANLANANAACTIEDDDHNISAWTRRAKITFSGYGRSTPLTNFPALVKPTSIPGFSFSDVASPAAGDLRFTDESATKLLPCEIEKWDQSGESFVWVLLPELSGTNTSIWAYWGNEAETTPPPTLRGAPVWNSDYLGVWHLHANEHDATGKGHHGTTNGTANGAGQIADGQTFDGDDDYISLGDIDALDESTRFTASLWFNRDTNRTDSSNHGVDNVLMAQSSASDNDNFEIGTSGANVEIYIDSGNGTEDTMRTVVIGVENGRWHYLAFTYDEDAPSEGRIYLDGELVNERAEWGGILDSSQSSPLSLGIARAGSDNWGDFAGAIDEARLSSMARSSNWVWACWMNQGPHHGAFVIYKPVETIDARETSHGTPYAWLDAHTLVTNDYETADTGDTDGDGMSAWEEYVAGTDPTKPESVFKILKVDPDGELTWFAGTNALNHPFYIYRTTQLLGEVWGTPYATRPRHHGTNTWQDPDPQKPWMRFYRIAIPQ